MSDLQDRLEAELFRQVPTAFWLDPNRWGDAPKPPPPSPPSPPPPRPTIQNPAHSWLLQSTWEGIPVVAADFAYHDMTYRLLLEGGRAVVVPEEQMRQLRWRVR